MSKKFESKIPLSIQLSPKKPDFGGYNLLFDLELERTPMNAMSRELNEIKAQIDIVNEDRERLKYEINSLKQERELDFYKLISSHMGPFCMPEENKKIEILQQNINDIRKQCGDTDKLLNSMKSLLGDQDLSSLLKENQGKKEKPIRKSIEFIRRKRTFNN